MFVRYADDFVITCKSKEFLEEKVVPAVNEFLAVRGLWLNPKKTVITNLHDGFNFLGYNFKLYPWPKHPSGYVLLTKPAKEKVKNFRLKVKTIVKASRNLTPYILIVKLNPIIRGWGNYYCNVVSKKTFASLDWYIWHTVLRWLKTKYWYIGVRKLVSQCFRPYKGRKLMFYGKDGDKEVQILLLAEIPIVRHGLGADLNPYLIENAAYF